MASRALRITLLAGGSLLAIAALVVARREHDTARASDPAKAAAAPPARLGLLHGMVEGTTSDVSIASIDASDAASNVAPIRALGVVTHEKGSAVRGALLPGRAVGAEVAFVVAAEPAPRGTSYGAALHRVEGGKVMRLCGDVALAATPIVTRTGRVIVARGVDGVDPPESEAKKLILRVDELSIDDVDPSSGAIHTLWRGKGYQSFLATTVAASGTEEIVVYLSTPTGAELFALDPSSGVTRPLARVMPFARDFSFDPVHKALVFADLATDEKTYQVLSLPLASMGAPSVLFSTSNEHAMPFALPTGEVAYSTDGDKGLGILATAGAHHRLLSPLGDGSDAATHASADGRWIAVRHTPRTQTIDHPPIVVALDVVTQKVIKLGTPIGDFVEPIGFASAGGAP